VAATKFLLSTADEFQALAVRHNDHKVVIVSAAPRNFILALKVDGDRLEFQLRASDGSDAAHVFRDVADCLKTALKLTSETHIYLEMPYVRYEK